MDTATDSERALDEAATDSGQNKDTDAGAWSDPDDSRVWADPDDAPTWRDPEEVL